VGFAHALVPAASLDHIGIWVKPEAQPLGDGDPAAFRGECIALDGRFEIKPTPFDHGFGRSERSPIRASFLIMYIVLCLVVVRYIST
jgi:hypothetical protein